MPECSKFFEAFKKQQNSPRFSNPKRNSKQFYFGLFEDDAGIYVKTVSRSLRDKKVNSDYFSGNLKSVIDLYNFKKTSTKLIIDWNNPYSHLYLDQHPDLLNALTTIDNLVDSNGKPVYYGSKTYPLTLNIKQRNDVLECSVTLCENIVKRVINDKYSLVGNRIISTLPIGNNFKSLIELNTSIIPSELDKYLSIVYSNFDNIVLNYKGFKTIHSGECELLPSIVIENVDVSGFLIIRTSFSYKQLITPEFYISYKPTKLALLNYDMNELTITDLILPDMDVLDRLIQILFYMEKEHSLEDSFHIEEDGLIVNPSMAGIMFTSELKSILDEFSIYGSKVLSKYKIKKSSINLELNITSAIDYLQGSAILNISGEKIPYSHAMSLFNKKGYIPLKDGTRGIVNKKYIEKIKKVIREGKEGIEVSFFDMPYIENILEAKVTGNHFIKKLALYKRNSEDLINTELRLEQFHGELRDYQSSGVRWMLNLHEIGISGCLSDDMGLGKTVQTIAFLLQVIKKRDGRSILIVLPKSLIFNWIKEVEKFAPHLDVYTYYGSNRDHKSLSKHTIILTTYQTLRNDIEIFRGIEFYYTILDEIQNIKNHTSLTAKATFLISSQYKLGISGTPVENSLGDLYSICRFLNPTMFGSFKRFKDEWSGPIGSEDSEIVTNILKNKIKPLFLRRIKEDVLKDLPPKTEQVLYIDMNRDQASYYEKVRKDYHDKIRLKIRDEGIDKSQLTIIKAFMELRQIATIPDHITNGRILSPKKEIILEQLYETLEGGHKVLIFSNFLSAIRSISESLEADRIDHRIITGSTTKRERVVEEFMDDPEVKVMIMTLKTGGVGLNLTAASYVYIIDPWWNIASENQAIDRTHRIGQDSSVFCYRFIARGTIEEKILELQDKKRALFNNLFDTAKSGSYSFTDDDINYLLG